MHLIRFLSLASIFLSCIIDRFSIGLFTSSNIHDKLVLEALGVQQDGVAISRCPDSVLKHVLLQDRKSASKW